jgi:6-phosphofructokinase 1
MVGYWNQHFTLVPLNMVAGMRKRLDPSSGVWQRVLENTGQPASMI